MKQPDDKYISKKFVLELISNRRNKYRDAGCGSQILYDTLRYLEKKINGQEENIPVDVLKSEAARQGYRLLENKKREKLLPCVCGSKRREMWITIGAYFYKCPKCGIESDRVDKKSELPKAWNDMIRKKEKEGECLNA